MRIKDIKVGQEYAVRSYPRIELGAPTGVTKVTVTGFSELTKTVFPANSFRGHQTTVKAVTVTTPEGEDKVIEARKFLGTWEAHEAARKDITDYADRLDAALREVEKLAAEKGVTLHFARRSSPYQSTGTVTLTSTDVRKLMA